MLFAGIGGELMQCPRKCSEHYDDFPNQVLQVFSCFILVPDSSVVAFESEH